MKIKFLLLSLPVLAALLSCARETASSPVPEDEEPQAVSPYVPGVALVKLSEEEASVIEACKGDIPSLATKGSGIATVLSDLGAVSIKRILPDAGKFEKRTREAGLHRWYTLEYDSEIPATKAAASFSSLPGVERFERVTRAKPCGFFNDPLLSQQWHYYSDGSISKAGADVDVVPVWDEFTTGRSDVIVAVVDGGIDNSHEDLAGQVLVSKSYNYVRGNTFLEPHSHGTHVAGTIAAINNNGVGACGLAGGDAAAGNSGVKLISYQVFAHNPEDPEHDLAATSALFASAIKKGADNGAVICSNSWGNDYEKEEDARNDVTSSFFKECIDYFNQYAGLDENGDQVGPMAGGIVVFAAGNDNWRYAHPCDYEGVIAVGAMDATGSKAYYSNYGDWVDICAPGGSINNKTVISTIPGNQYAGYQGTSMACPHVSGVAALIVSYYGGPGFTRDMLLNRLFGGVKKGFVPSYYQIGELVSAYGAMCYGENFAPEQVTSVSTEVHSNALKYTWKVGQSTSGVKAYGYKIILSESAAALSGINPASPPATTVSKTITVGDTEVGDDISVTFSDLKFSQDYYAVVAGYDISGNYSAPSPVVNMSTDVNHAPDITIDFDRSEFLSFEVVKFPLSVVDVDGHNFTVELQGGNEAIYLGSTPLSGRELVVNAPKADAGNYSVTIVATDSYGAASQKALSFSIRTNNPPAVIAEQEDIFFEGKGKKITLDLSTLINDADGEELTYKLALSSNGVIHPAIVGATLNMTSLSLGSTTVTVTGTDAKGESASVEFRILVRDQAEEVQTFPNPVKDRLGIRVKDEVKVSVRISNRSGAVVFSAEGVEIDPFNPYYVTMKGLPGGVYYVSLKGSGIDKVFTVAKQ